MAEKPILFNSVMVRAILGGRKTQTRRVIKPQPKIVFDSNVVFKASGKDGGQTWSATSFDADRPRTYTAKCPYGVVGDRLWMRETFGIFDVDADEDVAIAYKADDSDAEWFKNKRQDFNDLRLGKWRPSIHMKKVHARLWLEITGIRVERVQEIPLGDCYAEGIQSQFSADYANPDNEPIRPLVVRFKELWDSINAKRGYGWESNPWVFVIEFRKVKNAD